MRFVFIFWVGQSPRHLALHGAQPGRGDRRVGLWRGFLFSKRNAVGVGMASLYGWHNKANTLFPVVVLQAQPGLLCGRSRLAGQTGRIQESFLGVA